MLTDAITLERLVTAAIARLARHRRRVRTRARSRRREAAEPSPRTSGHDSSDPSRSRSGSSCTRRRAFSPSALTASIVAVHRLAWLAPRSWSAVARGEPPSTAPASPHPSSTASVAAPTHTSTRLLLNGGGSKAQNVPIAPAARQQLFAQLERAGRRPIAHHRLPAATATIPIRTWHFSDEQVPPDFWLCRRHRDSRCRRPSADPATRNTSVDDVPVRPATKADLAAMVREDEGRATRGRRDVLLLYVTDHGTKNADDTDRTTRSRSGAPDESLSVQELTRCSTSSIRASASSP